ncbi:MAG: hypothetical protein IPK82_19215 [Polyangiaceae bacterium]|nr:hypothetical protein [Polyangiaceae bacterium]
MVHSKSEQPPSPSTHLPKPLPTVEHLQSLQVQEFLSNLDLSANAISLQSSLASILPSAEAENILTDPRFAHADQMFRATLRGALVATSLSDLPSEVVVHPGVQNRIWNSLNDMDAAVVEISKTLSNLTPEERAQITAALRSEPSLSTQILGAIDEQAKLAGVSEQRRAHFAQLGEHAFFRLKLSTSTFIDEQVEKVQKVAPRPVEEAERYLEAQLGSTQFQAQKNWHLTVAEMWKGILAEETRRLTSDDQPSSVSPDDAYAPPAAGAPPPASPFNPDAGKKVLRVGAWLFGIGAFAGLTGAILVNQRDSDVVLSGLFSFTAAAVLSISGLICLLIGAILRARANARRDDFLENETS